MNFYMLSGAIFVLIIFSFGLKIHNDPGPLNNIFAYRTNRSIRNEDTWLEANVFAGRCLMYFATIFLILLLLGGSLFISTEFTIYAMTFCLVICGVSVVAFTEKHLQQVFFRDGKRKPTSL